MRYPSAISICNLPDFVMIGQKLSPVLSLVGRQDSSAHERNFDWPSWALDLAIPTNMDPWLGDGRKPPVWASTYSNPRDFTSAFLFTRNSTADCKFALQMKTLKVTGFSVDTIVDIKPHWIDLVPGATPEGGARHRRRICRELPDPLEYFRQNAFCPLTLKVLYIAILLTKQRGLNTPELHEQVMYIC
jgi:hypothetical protein